LKINMFGSFANPASTEAGMAEGFRSLGVEVNTFDTRQSKDYIQQAQVADIQLFIKGDGVNPNWIQGLSGITINWYSELLPDGSEDDLADLKLKQLQQNLAAFDILAVHEPSCLEYMQTLHPRVVCAPSYGVSVGREVKGPKWEKRPFQVGFVGHPTPRRIEWIDQISKHFQIMLPANWKKGGRTEGDEMFKFIKNCQFFLNIHCSKRINTETRVFEVTGCGACLLTEPLSASQLPSHVVVHSPDDVVEALSNKTIDFARTAAAGQTEVWDTHTYSNKCKQFLSIIKRIALGKEKLPVPQKEEPSVALQVQEIPPKIFTESPAEVENIVQAAVMGSNITKLAHAGRVVSSYKRRKPLLSRRNTPYRVGFVNIWFERGQSYVARMMAGALERHPQIETYILARTGGVHGEDKPPITTGKWAHPRITSYPQYQIKPTDLLNWVKANNLDVVIFNEEYDFSLPFVLRGHCLVMTYLDYFKEDWKPALNIYDLVLTSTEWASAQIKGLCNYVKLDWRFDAQGLEGYYTPLERVTRNRRFTFVHNAGWLGINYRKGTDKLILAFDKLLQEHPEWTLGIWCQTSRDKLPLECQRVLNERDSSITWIEESTEDDLLLPYNLGAIHVYPSKLDGLGLCLPEAIFAGIPTVTTDHPPMNEFITPKYGELIKVDKLVTREDGIIFPEVVVSVESIAEAMERCHTNMHMTVRESVDLNPTFDQDLSEAVLQAIKWHQ